LGKGQLWSRPRNIRMEEKDDLLSIVLC
jgi:hypothetical protein